MRDLPHHNAFYFFTDIGQYTGKFASSLADFGKKIEIMDKKSVEFHFERGDFEKWIGTTVGDTELADEISKIPKSSEGENLRERIHQAVSRRLTQLKKLLASQKKYLERT